jgi:ACS family pantothenate transporter-like MFS transporter
MGFLHRLRVAVWGVPPDTAAERRLLFKIDFFVLTYVCLMYWVSTCSHGLKTYPNPVSLIH